MDAILSYFGQISKTKVIGGGLSCFTIGGLVYVCVKHYYLCQSRKGEPPIRWSWIPLIGFALEMGKRPLQLIEEGRDLYGEIFGMVVLGNRMFIITDPLAYSTILRPSSDLSTKEFHRTVLQLFFGETHDKNKTKCQVDSMNDDLMRAWFIKYLYSEKGFMNLSLRSQAEAYIQTHTMIGNGTCVDMFHFLGEMVFKISSTAMFNEHVLCTDPHLFDKMVTFDSALPAAAAGIDISNLKASIKARSDLYQCILNSRDHSNNDQNYSEFIAKRWDHFDSEY